MKEPLNIEITRLYALTDPLLRAQFCFSECFSPDGARFGVTLMLYGEAALSVVRTQFPAATSHTGDWPAL
jgi:hypothetical protein